MELLIVIVNYNRVSLTLDCLESLSHELKELRDVQVGLCDNGSQPPDADVLERSIAERGWNNFVKLTRLWPNAGFTGGNNEVIRASLASESPPNFVLLLNNDTIVRPGAVSALLDFLKSRPDVGIAGSRLEDPDGTPQVSAFRFINPLSEFDRGLRMGVVSRLLRRHVLWQPIPTQSAPADWVAGASMMVRREVFDSIGLLDDGYFTYFDDVDFCFVANRHNWPTWYVPQSRIVHLVGQTTGVTDRDNIAQRKPEYYFEARRRYLTKNMHPIRAAACDLGFILGNCIYRVRCFVSNADKNLPAYTLRDHIRHSVFIRGFHPPTVANPALTDSR